ncbi:MAG: family 10 glycosylhydrolase, partial [Armatimonadota bacterium]
MKKNYLFLLLSLICTFSFSQSFIWADENSQQTQEEAIFTPMEHIYVAPPEPVEEFIPFEDIKHFKLDEKNNKIGYLQNYARENNLQARIMWVDATANLGRTNTVDGIREIVDNIKKYGFNMVVMDVKPISGEVLYPSKYAPKITKFRDFYLPPEFDPVEVFVEYAKDQGLEIVASMNTFSEGHRMFDVGPAYEKKEWQAIICEPRMYLEGLAGGKALVAPRVNTSARGEHEIAVYTDINQVKYSNTSIISIIDSSNRILLTTDGNMFPFLDIKLPTGGAVLVGKNDSANFLRQYTNMGTELKPILEQAFVPIEDAQTWTIPLWVNPNNPEVRQRLLDMTAELMNNYDFDGVIYDDRMRFTDVNSDMSELSRTAFEKYIGKKLNWPDDVLRWEVDFPSMQRRMIPGPYMEAWIVWRNMSITNWLIDSVNTVKSIRNDATVSVYVGSWYGEYSGYGSNWA